MSKFDAAREAMRQLVSRLSLQEPHTGWTARDLPKLTTTDYAVILRANPDVFDDIRLDAASIADALDSGAHEAQVLAGMSIMLQLQRELRDELLRALRAYSEEQEIAKRDPQRISELEAELAQGDA